MLMERGFDSSDHNQERQPELVLLPRTFCQDRWWMFRHTSSDQFRINGLRDWRPSRRIRCIKRFNPLPYMRQQPWVL